MSRLRTFLSLMRHLSANRWFLVPLLLVLGLAGALMLATNSLGPLAPFVYAVF